jgi:hypothetical protein
VSDDPVRERLVRAVENTQDQERRDMDTGNTQDGAEQSGASAGSRREPVAWANADDDGIYEVGLSEAHAHYVCQRAANGKYSHRNPRIVPLYRSPQPTLTDEEREAIERSIRYWRGGFRPHPFATVLSQLLRRLQQLK